MQCREAQHAISREMDGDLNWRERILLRLHLRYCWCCKRLADQFKVMRRILHGMEEKHDFGEAGKLSSDSRKKLSDALKKAAEEEDSK